MYVKQKKMVKTENKSKNYRPAFTCPNDRMNCVASRALMAKLMPVINPFIYIELF